MVRRACLRASSSTKNRGPTPRELSTVPTAAAARILFHRPGDAEAEEPTVQQLGCARRGNARYAAPWLAPSFDLSAGVPWLTSAVFYVTWPEQNLAAPVSVPRRHWVGPRPSRSGVRGMETASFV